MINNSKIITEIFVLPVWVPKQKFWGEMGQDI